MYSKPKKSVDETPSQSATIVRSEREAAIGEEIIDLKAEGSLLGAQFTPFTAGKSYLENPIDLQELRSGFERLKTPDSSESIPTFNKLLSIERDIERQLAELAEHNEGHEYAVHSRLLKLLDPEKKKELLGKVFQKLEDETSYFAGLKETSVHQYALGENTEWPVIHDSSEKAYQQWATSKANSRGFYHSASQSIFMRPLPPDAEEILDCLLQKGCLPKYFAILHHEIIHAIQNEESLKDPLSYQSYTPTPIELAKMTAKTLLPDGFLKLFGTRKLENTLKPAHDEISLIEECHAYEAMPMLPALEPVHSGREPATLTRSALYNTSLYSFSNGLALGLGVGYMESFRQLRYLGLSDREIAQKTVVSAEDVFQETKEGRRRQSGRESVLGMTGKLQSLVEENRNRLGLTNDADYEVFLQSKDCINQVEIAYGRLQARKAVLVELEEQDYENKLR